MPNRSLAFTLEFLGWARWIRASASGLGADARLEQIDKARRRGAIGDDMAALLRRRFVAG